MAPGQRDSKHTAIPEEKSLAAICTEPSVLRCELRQPGQGSSNGCWKVTHAVYHVFLFYFEKTLSFHGIILAVSHYAAPNLKTSL